MPKQSVRSEKMPDPVKDYVDYLLKIHQDESARYKKIREDANNGNGKAVLVDAPDLVYLGARCRGIEHVLNRYSELRAFYEFLYVQRFKYKDVCERMNITAGRYRKYKNSLLVLVGESVGILW